MALMAELMRKKASKPLQENNLSLFGKHFSPQLLAPGLLAAFTLTPSFWLHLRNKALKNGR